MVEVVTQIKTAEEQADEIKKDARRQARQLRDDATISGKGLVDKKTQQAGAEAAKLISEAEAKAQAFLENAARDSAGECDAVIASAKKNADKAAQFIVERIVNSL